jgi:hypothetical protein
LARILIIVGHIQKYDPEYDLWHMPGLLKLGMLIITKQSMAGGGYENA